MPTQIIKKEAHKWASKKMGLIIFSRGELLIYGNVGSICSSQGVLGYYVYFFWKCSFLHHKQYILM